MKKNNSKKRKIVPNDVYKFDVRLSPSFDFDRMSVYVDEGAFERDEDKVQEAYFTQAKIDELKNELINKIRKCKNPFSIICSDLDGGYNVTEDELFRG